MTLIVIRNTTVDFVINCNACDFLEDLHEQLPLRISDEPYDDMFTFVLLGYQIAHLHGNLYSVLVGLVIQLTDLRFAPQD